MTAARLPAPHLLAGALCVGLAASLVVRVPGMALPLAVAALALAAPFLGPRRALAVAGALAAAGLWWGSVRLEALDASELVSVVGETELALVEVTGPARRSEFTVRVPVRVRRFGDLTPHEPARLELPRGRAPPQGAVLELVATAREPRPAEPGRSFDEREYLRRQGVHVVLRAGWFREVGRRGGVPGLADTLRARIADSIAPGVDGERRSVIAGVVLGEDEGLSPELRDDFRASGLYHLLAVSGQNVAYIVFGALLAAWALAFPRWAGHIVALLGIAGYALAVGWQPSVVRAAVAGGLASLAWLAARPADRWYFFLVGAAVLLAVNPYGLLEPGFQLSFSAVAAIFVLVPRVERRLEGYPVPRKVAALVAVSLACGLVTAPVLWFHFEAVPLYSVLANALAAPVVGPLLGLGLTCAGLAHLLPGAAAALAWVNGWFAAYLAWCARAVADLPYAQATSPRALLVAALVVALAFVAGRLRPPRAPRLAALAAIAVALAATGWGWLGDGGRAAPPTGLRVTFLDVGQGDAVLVEVPEGALLVDQGPPEGEAAEQLERLGVERLSALVLTHPQRDHIGGAADVLTELDVELVLDPAIPAESPDEEAALRAAARREVRVVTARVGQSFRLGELRVRVLWPDGPGPPGDDPNNRAIVLFVSYGETDVLLTADAESNVTLPLRLPPAEVFKIAHHGSADDGLPALLDRVRPRVAVISVGRRNHYGHPARSTLAALEAVAGLAVYRTDEDGRVVVESDGERIWVREER